MNGNVFVLKKIQNAGINILDNFRTSGNSKEFDNKIDLVDVGDQNLSSF